MSYVDTMRMCDSCCWQKWDGIVQVGRDDEGGGPENSYICAKGKDMSPRREAFCSEYCDSEPEYY